MAVSNASMTPMGVNSSTDYDFYDPWFAFTHEGWTWFEKQMSIRKIVMTVTNVYIAGLLCIFGLVGNILNLLVFYRQGIFSDSCTVSLTVMSVSDGLLCLFGGFEVACLYIFSYHSSEESSWHWTLRFYETKIGAAPKEMVTHMICFTTCYLSVERFISIVLPFRVQTIFTVRRTCVVLCVSFVSVLVLYFPFYAGWYVDTYSNNGTSLEASYLISYEYDTISRKLIYTFLRPILIGCVFIFNALIIWRHRVAERARSKLQGMTSSTGRAPGDNTEGSNTGNRSAIASHNISTAYDISRRRSNKLVRMILVISCLFLVCYLPMPLGNILLPTLQSLYGDNPFRFTLLLTYIEDIRFFLAIVNSSVSIIIYLAMSSRYKKDFKASFCKKCTQGAP